MRSRYEGETDFTGEACGKARVSEYYDLIALDDSCVIPETISHWYALEREKAKQ